MSILEQFNKVAGDYDKNRKKFVPCFDDFYDNSTKFIAANIAKPRKIIDLGAGTGLLTYHWCKHYPEAKFALVDVTEEMLNIAKITCGVVVLLLLFMVSTTAMANYPTTLDGGNLVLVDGGMGVGRYADRSSAVVQLYCPPDYIIDIDIVSVIFSDEYWRQHDTYIGGPYEIGEAYSLSFRYRWDDKTLFYKMGEEWKAWDINHDYSHAEGDPMIPSAAEVAFVAAYNMRFFDNKLGYSPVLKRQRRVIDESLYQALGI